MLFLIFGLFFSYIYSIYVLPKKEGFEPSVNPIVYPILYKGMIIIPYSNEKAIHLHHWVIYCFICILSVFMYIPDLIIGFSLGLFLQGISYNDSLHFICKNPYH